MTTGHVDVPGGRLFVIDEGSGPPIDLLHAGIADSRSWDAMVSLLNRAGYRTIRYDQRGAGRSTTEDVEFSRAGDLDIPDVVQTARHVEANAPNARALVWPDVAHMIGMEQPERLASTIVEFVAPLERWS